MGTSAFDPVILADVRSVRHKIDISGACGDVLSVGDVVRYDPDNDYYVRARANTEANSNFVGVIESISGTDITLVYSGEIDLPTALFSAIGSGYTGAQVFYLSDTQAGKLTYVPPSAPGSVIKPVIMVNSDFATESVDGVVVNTVGNVIKGDSTVDLSEVQPVGSVLAFAGYTGDIPTGWDICDGGFLDISTYSDLYAALNDGSIYGFIQNIGTMLKASGSGSLTTASLSGTKFYFVPTGGNGGAFEATILSGTMSGTGIVNAQVFVNPIYVDGPTPGAYHNGQLSDNNFQFQLYNSTGGSLDLTYEITSVAANNQKVKFKKPDLRSRFIIGDSRSITGAEPTAFDSYIVGSIGGEESHVLSITEMPIHGHNSTYTAILSGSVTHNLTTASSGVHNHSLYNQSNIDFDLGGSDTVVRFFPNGGNPTNSTALPTTGTQQHTHQVTGNISVSGLTPVVSGTIANTGGGLAHNNLPQYMAMIWIIKTRKDSAAKLFRLGPSGGGAIIAKNTAKRWLRSTSGAGCTVDISYGNFQVTRLGTGDYQFTHNMLQELGTADQDKYIVEATVVKNGSGITQMFIANPYNLQGLTFGVKVYDILGATFSDNFQYLNFTIYGGGTAL